MIKPQTYANSCLDAISVWSLKVLPVLFPFFIFTRLIVNLSDNKQNFMDKFFTKLYNTPKGSFNTYFLSTLSGYPMGAKLICTMHNNKQIDTKDAKKMLSFCSVSGPMFMLGTVGVSMLKNFKAGIIILVSNIIASLFNGLLYRGKKVEFKYISNTYKNNSNILADSVYDSLISILMVGAYIVLSFLIIEILKNLRIIYYLSFAICHIFKCSQLIDVIQSILCGIIEITKGILDLSTTSINLSSKTIIASSLIGFGGVSIMMQSLNFLSKLKIPFKTMLKQKITQCILCAVITTIICKFLI